MENLGENRNKGNRVIQRHFSRSRKRDRKREEGKERKSENRAKREDRRRRRDKTSRSGRSVLIKRTQGPRTLNMFGPVDVFQRGRMVNYEGRKREKKRKKNAGSGVYKVASRA